MKTVNAILVTPKSLKLLTAPCPACSVHSLNHSLPPHSHCLSISISSCFLHSPLTLPMSGFAFYFLSLKKYNFLGFTRVFPHTCAIILHSPWLLPHCSPRWPHPPLVAPLPSPRYSPFSLLIKCVSSLSFPVP